MKRAICSVWALAVLGCLSCVSLGQTINEPILPNELKQAPVKEKRPFSLKRFFVGFKRLTPKFRLSKPQKDRVDALVKKTEDDEDRIEDSEKLEHPVRQSKLEALHERFEQQLFTILTPPQIKAYEEGCKQLLKALHLGQRKARAL